MRVGETLGSESRAREPFGDESTAGVHRINAGCLRHPPAKTLTALLLLEVLRSFNKLPQII